VTITQFVSVQGTTVKLQEVIRVEWGQISGFAGTLGQHNFAVLCPTHHTMTEPPGKDPVILIFDPWFTLLPIVYTTKEHAAEDLFGRNVDVVGFDKVKVEPARKRLPDYSDVWREMPF
jgi:hypothetical protein